MDIKLGSLEVVVLVNTGPWLPKWSLWPLIRFEKDYPTVYFVTSYGHRRLLQIIIMECNGGGRCFLLCVAWTSWMHTVFRYIRYIRCTVNCDTQHAMGNACINIPLQVWFIETPAETKVTSTRQITIPGRMNRLIDVSIDVEGTH